MEPRGRLTLLLPLLLLLQPRLSHAPSPDVVRLLFGRSPFAGFHRIRTVGHGRPRPWRDGPDGSSRAAAPSAAPPGPW